MEVHAADGSTLRGVGVGDCTTEAGRGACMGVDGLVAMPETWIFLLFLVFVVVVVVVQGRKRRNNQFLCVSPEGGRGIYLLL